MIAAVLAILAAANLAAPFGEATATAAVEEPYIAVTVAVAIDPGYDADFVVVHLLNPEGQETFTLGRAPDGRYEGRFTVLPFNRAVVFEVGRGAESVLSETVSLLDLGVDPELLQTTFATPSPEDDGRWGWLALATGALAAGALLGWWVWPKRSPVFPPPALTDPDGNATVVVDD